MWFAGNVKISKTRGDIRTGVERERAREGSVTLDKKGWGENICCRALSRLWVASLRLSGGTCYLAALCPCEKPRTRSHLKLCARLLRGLRYHANSYDAASHDPCGKITFPIHETSVIQGGGGRGMTEHGPSQRHPAKRARKSIPLLSPPPRRSPSLDHVFRNNEVV